MADARNFRRVKLDIRQDFPQWLRDGTQGTSVEPLSLNTRRITANGWPSPECWELTRQGNFVKDRAVGWGFISVLGQPIGFFSPAVGMLLREIGNWNMGEGACS